MNYLSQERLQPFSTGLTDKQLLNGVSAENLDKSRSSFEFQLPFKQLNPLSHRRYGNNQTSSEKQLHQSFTI